MAYLLRKTTSVLTPSARKSELNTLKFMATANRDRLPEIIKKHSNKKPIMVFCCTRKSTIITAKSLAGFWALGGEKNRQWAAPTSIARVSDTELAGMQELGADNFLANTNRSFGLGRCISPCWAVHVG